MTHSPGPVSLVTRAPFSPARNLATHEIPGGAGRSERTANRRRASRESHRRPVPSPHRQPRTHPQRRLAPVRATSMPSLTTFPARGGGTGTSTGRAPCAGHRRTACTDLCCTGPAQAGRCRRPPGHPDRDAATFLSCAGTNGQPNCQPNGRSDCSPLGTRAARLAAGRGGKDKSWNQAKAHTLTRSLAHRRRLGCCPWSCSPSWPWVPVWPAAPYMASTLPPGGQQRRARRA
jgi:hypothetical protein